MAKNDFQYGGWNNYTLQCGKIVTLISPGGSTLQCGRWLWDDMPWNLPKRLPYWNSTSDFDFDHITTVDMSFCTSLEILSKSDLRSSSRGFEARPSGSFLT